MNKHSSRGRLSILCILIFLASIIVSLFQLFQMSLILLIAGGFIYKKKITVKHTVRQVDSEAILFLQTLLHEYSKSKNLYNSLVIASKSNFIFSEDFQSALNRYIKGVNAKAAFSGLSSYHSKYIDEAVAVIIGGLDGGAEIESAIALIKNAAIANDKYKLRSLGSFENSLSINKIGAILFFPLFAGISLDIIKFTALFNAQANVNLTGLAIVFVAYIIIANYLNVVYDERKGILDLLTKTSFFTSIGISIFKLTAIFAFALLGG